ncbi:MAG: galactitol-1-phosphate 5-dehydrogenase [Actinobacteria bacterium]|nr:galactitol-1-phosphate 5-dehydrogenase [Actinomycetota bacterium]
MKALVLEQYGKFIYKDVSKPQIRPNEVLVRVKACAICGSDVHGMDGSTGRRIPPIIMGHEAAGIIEEIGKQVKNFKIGDRVTFDSTIYCDDCSYCRSGKINLCENRKVLGVSCNGYHQDGTFAEYIAIPQHILYRLPDNINLNHASLIEPLSVALHAINNSFVKLNDTAIVVGSGMIGLLVIQLLKIAGCGMIIAVDIDSFKLEKALISGADIALKSDEVDVVKEVLKLTKGKGADISFEIVGIPKTIEIATKCLKKEGLLTLIGNLSPEVPIPLQFIVTREIKIKGSCASAGEYSTCIDMISKREINLDILISKVSTLKEGAKWFDKLSRSEPGLLKIILKP